MLGTEVAGELTRSLGRQAFCATTEAQLWQSTGLFSMPVLMYWVEVGPGGRIAGHVGMVAVQSERGVKVVGENDAELMMGLEILLETRWVLLSGTLDWPQM